MKSVARKTTEVPGLDPRDMEEIRRILGPYLDRLGGRLILFGSRARGDSHRASDIDLAIRAGSPVPAWLLAEMRERLEQSRLPLGVDLVDYSRAPEALKRTTDEEGIPWPT